MAVTAYEIARVVGVSSATVSMALNNKPGVGEETRRKILETAESMGYEKQRRNQEPLPSLSLVLYKKSGEVLGDTPFFDELIQGIEEAARQAGYGLLISYFYENQDFVSQQRNIEGLASQGIILLATEMNSADVQKFSRFSTPIILLDSSFHDLKFDSVTINNIQGAAEAVRYLIRMGHQKIGLLRSNVDINNFAERHIGFLIGAESLSLGSFSIKEFRERINKNDILIVPVAPVAELAYQDMKKFLETKPDLPTAFFADNDIIAMACIRALKEAGIEVPGRVSIIGFDDMRGAAVVDPPLSTMRVPKLRLGALAVEQLLKKIRGGVAETLRLEVNTELVERASVARYQHAE
jgi:LacI family transcriptional regulator